MKIKEALAVVVDAVTPKPTLAQCAERLRAARAKLAEARKITPQEPASYLGLPRADLVVPSIACCEAAEEVRDAELSFAQNDVESDEILHGLAKTLGAKGAQGRRLQAAVKAAQEALDAFCSGVDADVEQTTQQLQALSRQRSAEDLPRARNTLHERKFRGLLADLELEKAADWLRQPVPGLDPSQGNHFQSRIREIETGHAERERREAMVHCPSWFEADEWVAKWRKADSAERDELKAYARGERREGLFPRNHYPRA